MAFSIRRIAVALFFCAAIQGPAAAAESSPQATVRSLHELLVGVMQQAGGIRERMAVLEPRLEEIYDYRRMSAAVTGRTWSDAPEPARDAFVEAFGDLSAATYASRFKNYDGERFEIAGERKGPRDLQLVDTRIVPAGSEPVAISYVLYQDGTRWRIVDVLLSSSISEIAVRRSEYNAILRQSGLAGLTRVLNDKVAALLSAP